MSDTRKQMNVRSVSFDGCVFNQRYDSHDNCPILTCKRAHAPFTYPDYDERMLKGNNAFITAIASDIKTANYAQVTWMVGDDTQSKHVDQSRHIRNLHRGSSFIALEALRACTHNELKEPPHSQRVQLDGYVLADTYGNQVAGENFYHAIKIHTSHQYSHWIADSSLLSVVYAQMHRMAAENPDADITYDYYHGNTDILGDLAYFFAANPDLIPRNVKLRLHHYAGDDIIHLPAQQGTGDVDFNYHQNVRLMAQCVHASASPDTDAYPHEYNFLQLLTERPLAQFKQQRQLTEQAVNLALFGKIYAAMHQAAIHYAQSKPRLATDIPETTTYEFSHGNSAVLRSLSTFFAAHPGFIPKNVTLRLSQYHGRKTTTIAEHQGTSEIDAHYQRRVKGIKHPNKRPLTTENLRHFAASRRFAQRPVEPAKPGFFKRHWKKILVGALIGLAVIGIAAFCVFTFGAGAAVVGGIMIATGLSAGGAIAVGATTAAAVGIGVGAAVGASAGIRSDRRAAATLAAEQAQRAATDSAEEHVPLLAEDQSNSDTPTPAVIPIAQEQAVARIGDVLSSTAIVGQILAATPGSVNSPSQPRPQSPTLLPPPPGKPEISSAATRSFVATRC